MATVVEHLSDKLFCIIDIYCNMSILQVDSVRKQHKGMVLLRDIFFLCEKGEILNLFGRNGSGKSTLLEIIFGSQDAEQRYVAVDGIPLIGLSRTSRKINYLPQQHFLPSHLSVKHVIQLFCFQDFAKIIDKAFIKPILDSKISALSGGEKRLVEVVILLNSNVEFILLDEPFTRLSPIYKEIVKSLILEQSKEKGIIISDHDYDVLDNISSSDYFLKNGCLLKVDVRQDLVAYGYIPVNKI